MNIKLEALWDHKKGSSIKNGLYYWIFHVRKHPSTNFQLFFRHFIFLGFFSLRWLPLETVLGNINDATNSQKRKNHQKWTPPLNSPCSNIPIYKFLVIFVLCHFLTFFNIYSCKIHFASVYFAELLLDGEKQINICMFLSCHVHVLKWIHTLYFPKCQGTPCSKQTRHLTFKDCNGTRTHNRLVRKRILNYLVKLAFRQIG